jgi:hypothetical protein
MLEVLIKLTLFLIALLKPTKILNSQATLRDSFNLGKRLASTAISVETTLQLRILTISYLTSTATPQISEIIQATSLLWIRLLILTLQPLLTA